MLKGGGYLDHFFTESFKNNILSLKVFNSDNFMHFILDCFKSAAKSCLHFTEKPQSKIFPFYIEKLEYLLIFYYTKKGQTYFTL